MQVLATGTTSGMEKSLITVECPAALVVMLSFAVNVHICMLCFVISRLMMCWLIVGPLMIYHCPMLCELDLVRDGVLSFTESHFSAADARCFIEFLCIVWLIVLLSFYRPNRPGTRTIGLFLRRFRRRRPVFVTEILRVIVH